MVSLRSRIELWNSSQNSVGITLASCCKSEQGINSLQHATSHHNTSAFRSVCACMARVWKTYVCGTGACVWYPRVSGTWVRSPVCARHDPRKCKNETSREKCYSCVVACCMLLVCSRMYSYLLVYYSYVLVSTRMHSYVLVCTLMYSYVISC